MHGEPHVANDGVKKSGELLRHGLVIAIEPWFMLGTDKLKIYTDGWTLRSADDSRVAHSEPTVAITKDGPIVSNQPRGLKALLSLLFGGRKSILLRSGRRTTS